MSMASTAWSQVCGPVTVFSKPYRLTHRTVMGSMPASSRFALCSWLERSARRPPWILGWSVFIRPSIISGNPVTSATSVTASPAARNAFAVPPVLRISKPSAISAEAKSATPDLSVTEMRARGMVLAIVGCRWWCRRRWSAGRRLSRGLVGWPGRSDSAEYWDLC